MIGDTANLAAEARPSPSGEEPANIMLEAQQITKELGRGAGKVRSLKGVSLSLRAGELTLLMGPSGSGKTTLLSILGCILTPTEGSLAIAGHSTTGMTPVSSSRIMRATSSSVVSREATVTSLVIMSRQRRCERVAPRRAPRRGPRS